MQDNPTLIMMFDKLIQHIKNSQPTVWHVYKLIQNMFGAAKAKADPQIHASISTIGAEDLSAILVNNPRHFRWLPTIRYGVFTSRVRRWPEVGPEYIQLVRATPYYRDPSL